MAKYILNQNKQDSASGENYELHNEGTCNRLPDPGNRLDVGYFDNCHDAMTQAKVKHPAMASAIDGCYYCCPECHRR